MLYLAYMWNLYRGNSQMAAHKNHHLLSHCHILWNGTLIHVDVNVE
jgi:hypothetical protein